MEVASPLPFRHSQGGVKRRFACSPISDSPSIGADVTDDLSMMDDSSGYEHSYKRRRCLVSEKVETPLPLTNVPSHTSFPPFATAAFGASRSQGSSSKRSRADDTEDATNSHTRHLQSVIDHQSGDIERLKSDKESIEAMYSELKCAHDKNLNENRILKKAVTIQQERQNHSASELDAARKYKYETDERVRMLEHIIMTLRYHLQAQQPCSGNDFMNGFSPRPPDVC